MNLVKSSSRAGQTLRKLRSEVSVKAVPLSVEARVLVGWRHCSGFVNQEKEECRGTILNRRISSMINARWKQPLRFWPEGEERAPQMRRWVNLRASAVEQLQRVKSKKMQLKSSEWLGSNYLVWMSGWEGESSQGKFQKISWTVRHPVEIKFGWSLSWSPGSAWN